MDHLLNRIAYLSLPRKLTFLEIITQRDGEDLFEISEWVKSKGSFFTHNPRVFQSLKSITSDVSIRATIVHVSGSAVLSKIKDEFPHSMLDAKRFLVDETNHSGVIRISVIKRLEMERIQSIVNETGLDVVHFGFGPRNNTADVEDGFIDSSKKVEDHPLSTTSELWKNWKRASMTYDYLIKRMALTYLIVFVVFLGISLSLIELGIHLSKKELQALQASHLLTVSNEHQLEAMRENDRKVMNTYMAFRPMKVSYAEALEDLARSSNEYIDLQSIEFFERGTETKSRYLGAKEIIIVGNCLTVERTIEFVNNLVERHWIKSATLTHYDGIKQKFEIRIDPLKS